MRCVGDIALPRKLIEARQTGDAVDELGRHHSRPNFVRHIEIELVAMAACLARLPLVQRVMLAIMRKRSHRFTINL
jgi:hypothetical protein